MISTRKLIKLFVTLLLGCYLIVYLNLKGICIWKLKCYSDQEKITLAVDFAFREYPKLMSQLGYQNSTDYLDTLTNCCKVGSGYIGGLEHNALFGKLSSFVVFPKLAKQDVLNKTDVELRELRAKLYDRDWIYIAMTNCGKPWAPFK